MKDLYTNKNQCCACSGCANICPKKIIEMRPDEYGFEYPYVINDSCIECNLCKKVCAFQSLDNRGSNPIKVYAAINKDYNVLSKSSSGGVFSAISKAVFKRGGVVFGCAFNSKMEPEHIYIEKIEDLYKIQGSKYVKSNMNNSFLYVKRFLEEGRLVFFTGTPCQVDSLKLYLKKSYENLITADLICHGVTNVEVFKGYIKYLEEKFNCKVINIKFRDKTKGWGHVEKITYVKRGRIREKYIYSFNSYYHMYFLKGYLLRENCYDCKYACGVREGDFSMGDFWGVELEHPEIDRTRGVSAFLVNSEKGIVFLEEIREYLYITESTFDKVKRKNAQLNKPISKMNKRKELLNFIDSYGNSALAKKYYDDNKKEIIISNIKLFIPRLVINSIKKNLYSSKKRTGKGEKRDV